jgi:16S rRNA (cytidine1402-2'-O)-methyltransferase
MSKLYIIPTPIGNLRDITLRAIDILKEVDIVLAEDTRKSAQLLKHYEIEAKTESYHKFNEHKKISTIIERLQSGISFGLISDAGTPGISDPGFLIVRECIKKSVEVVTLPGASAFLPALVNSGFPCDKFGFEGFLPQKKGRQKRLKELANENRTMVFYESPHRLLKTLEQFKEYLGTHRKMSVSREISKIHEETIRGTASELINHFEVKGVKGEIVIIVEALSKKTDINEMNTLQENKN